MLLDTSGLLICFDVSSDEHARAFELFTNSPTLLTHSGVLFEFVPLCRSRRMDVARATVFLMDLLDDPAVEAVWTDRALYCAALELLEARRDKRYSLCDAVSFLLMRERGLTEALTTDRHFEQEGFVRLLK